MFVFWKGKQRFKEARLWTRRRMSKSQSRPSRKILLSRRSTRVIRAGVAHDGYTLRPDARATRSTTWPERAPGASDPAWARSITQLASIPASAFALLKRRFHAHTPRIFLNLSTPSALITDEEPWLLTADVPHQAHIRLQRLFLPHTCFAIPAIAWLEHDLAKVLPRLFQFAVEETRARVCSVQTRKR